MSRVRCSIVGATGYTGMEAIRLMMQQPDIELHRAYGDSRAGERLSDVYPAMRSLADQTLRPMNELADEDADAVILALPHGASAARVRELLDGGYDGVIIDMSADFRLDDPEEYERWYGTPHPEPRLMPSFRYGLADVRGDELHGEKMIAAPGCFATALQLLLLPLIKAGLPGPFSVTGMTGSSGSGKTPSPTTHYTSRTGNLKGYKVMEHRHLAELHQSARHYTGARPAVRFLPVSAPLVRGIWMTAQFSGDDHNGLQQIYEPFYRGARSIRLGQGLPELSGVTGSNFADIGFVEHAEGSVAGIAIDNLIKGAAGQALQCMYLSLGMKHRVDFTCPPHLF